MKVLAKITPKKVWCCARCGVPLYKKEGEGAAGARYCCPSCDRSFELDPPVSTRPQRPRIHVVA